MCKVVINNMRKYSVVAYIAIFAAIAYVTMMTSWNQVLYSGLEFDAEYARDLPGITLPHTVSVDALGPFGTSRQSDIVIFYHVCNVGAQWKRIVAEQMTALVESGLYGAAAEMYYGCSCARCHAEVPEQMSLNLQDATKAKQLPAAPLYSHENMTINAVIEYARDAKNAGKTVFYFHTKGVTGRSPNQEYWREFMTAYNVYMWPLCHALIDRGFSTVGVNYQALMRPPHYSGNFWWASTAYLSKLSLITDTRNRLQAEMKLLSMREPGRHVNLGTELWFSCLGILGLYSPFSMGDAHARYREIHAGHIAMPETLEIKIF